MKFIVILNIFLIVFIFFQKESAFFDNMWIYYLIHYSSIYIYALSFIRKNFSRLTMLFSPILFSLIYLGVSFTLGAYFIPLKLGFDKEVYYKFIEIDKLGAYTIFFFIVDVILIYVWTKNTKKGILKHQNNKEIQWMDFKPSLFILLSFAFLCISFIEPITALFFGFSYPIKLVLIICLVLVCIKRPLKLKILIYSLILICVFVIHYSSKREIILVVFIFLFLESIYNNFKINFRTKSIIKISFIGIIGAYIIFAASIMRGYGSFKLDNKLEAFLLVPEYIGLDRFKHMFVENFEVNTVLGNTMICMDFVEKGDLPLQYGGTYLKLLLAPIPRSLWKNKPEGMILKYTYTLNPNHRKKGQSLPVVHYAEGFANFYWFGMIAVVFILVFFEKMFWYVITCNNMNILNGKLVFYTYVICILFQYIRGSGFDLFSLYCLIPTPLIIFISFLPRKKQLD